jgi:hypothetical protein
MTTIQRGALASVVAVTLVAALGLLAVALTGSELSLETVRGCMQSGGSILAVGLVALLMAFVVAFSRIGVRSSGSTSTRRRP